MRAQTQCQITVKESQLNENEKDVDFECEKQPLLCRKNTQKVSQPLPRKSTFREKLPPLLISVIIVFYFSYFTMGYILPNLFPTLYTFKSPLIPPIPTNKKNKYSSYLMIFLLLFSFANLIISFIKTVFTQCDEIPNDSLWQISPPDYLTPQEKMEYTALRMLKFEKQLNSNKNKISLNDFMNETRDLSRSPTSSASTTSSVSNDDYYIVNERDKDGEVRFCKTCNKFKPDRSHHCKFCDRCYLKLDHHCFWVNNCISISNYKYFYCFIFYVWILCIQFFIVFYPVFTQIYTKTRKNRNFRSFVTAFFLSSAMVALLIFLFSFLLWCYHVMLGLNNFTSFEYNALVKEIDTKNAEKFVEYSKFDKNIKIPKYIPLKSKYDIGKWNNWTQLFGHNILLWFIPIKTENNEEGANTGFNFKTNEGESIEVIASI